MLRNDREKIKLQNEAISEILVADTNSESGAEANDVEHDFEEEEKEAEEEEDEDDDGNKPQQKSKHRPQQVMDYQCGDCLKERTQIFILLSVQQKV